MLHVIYRSTGGENRKGRPPFYSKSLALESFVQSFRRLPAGEAEVLFLNDGPIPPERMALMQATGEVLNRQGMGLRGSLTTALALPLERGWPDRDVVWYAEDDYLYQPGALAALVEAAAAYPQAEYFALYAQIGDRAPNGHSPCIERVPSSWRPDLARQVAGHGWQRALSTTSTFGGRVAALRADNRMMRLVMRTGGAFDHMTCLMLQGFVPYRPAALARKVLAARGLRAIGREAGIAVARLGLNAYACWRILARAPRRTMVTPDPALITHMEATELAAGTDWSRLADQVRDVRPIAAAASAAPSASGTSTRC